MSIFIKKIYLTFLILSVIGHWLTAEGNIKETKAEAEWTLLIYAQAKNSLNNFAPRNFSDMASIGPNKNLNILIQWYRYGHQGSWRYRVEKGKIGLEGYIPAVSDGNKDEDLVDAVRWAHNKFPSKKFGLILWNHGVGILDPIWGQSMFLVNSSVAKNNPKIQIPGITFADESAQPLYPDNAFLDEHCLQTKHDIYRDELYDENTLLHRGILFNEQSRTYMNNQVLNQALSTIKNNVLQKKLDLLGMDACLMAMVEVGFQIKDCAEFMVASQEVELAYGWNYKNLLTTMADSTLSAYDVAKLIVLSYEAYYKNKINFYTQSAIDLGKINYLTQALDNVVEHIDVCDAVLKNKVPNIYQVISKVRSQCIQLSTPSYIDLNSFLVELERQIKIDYKSKHLNNHPLQQKVVSNLSKSIDLCKNILAHVVVANACGKYLSNAKGLSIYFPSTGIDQSYKQTLFAQNSLWLKFLKNLLSKRE